MVGVPTEARDLGATEHLFGRVVDVYHVFEDDAVVVHFDPFGDTGDSEKLPVLVKLDGRNDGSETITKRGCYEICFGFLFLLFNSPPSV